ncbi:DMT family transporter [Shimia sp. SDUM112013]|uniref:DMT family transporter n=1 Tax=Shimia sp. SDUM112013 TaxID=3136160 RepID=UPI0032EB627D
MNNLRGILMIILAMAGFTIEDMFIKSLSATLPTGQIMIGIGLGCALLFAGLALRNGENLFAPAAWRPLLLLRAASEAVATIFFMSALARVDISTVAAVFQATPLAIAMGAALFLGDQVGWRRWSAIGLGFFGVLLIIRPGLDGFEPASLLVLVTVVAVAMRDLVTRFIDSSVSSSIVSFQGFGSMVVGGALLLPFSGQALVLPQGNEPLMFAGAILFGAIGYFGIVTAMRVGQPAVVAPYRYTRLIFSILAGMLVFGERPDLLTLTGAALIIGSGLYTFLRERRLAEPAAA